MLRVLILTVLVVACVSESQAPEGSWTLANGIVTTKGATITGGVSVDNLTVTASILPYTNATCTVGSNSRYFNAVFTDSITATSLTILGTIASNVFHFSSIFSATSPTTTCTYGVGNGCGNISLLTSSSVWSYYGGTAIVEAFSDGIYQTVLSGTSSFWLAINGTQAVQVPRYFNPGDVTRHAFGNKVAIPKGGGGILTPGNSYVWSIVTSSTSGLFSDNGLGFTIDGNCVFTLTVTEYPF